MIAYYNNFKNLKNKIFTSRWLSSFSWNLFGNVISKGAVFLTSLLAANLLGAENFGRIGVIQQTTGMMITLSVMGLSQTAILFVGRNLSSSVELKRVIISKIMKVSIVATAIILSIYMLLVDYISLVIFEDINITYLLELCAFVLVGNTINQVQFGILSGLGKFKNIAITNITVGLLSVPITYMLMKEIGVAGFVWALILNSFLTLLMNKFFIYQYLNAGLVKVKKKIESNNELSIITYRSIITYASSNLVGAILFTVSSWLALGVLTRRAGLLDVSAFNASMQFFSIIYLVPLVLAQVLMSLTSQGSIKNKELNKIVMSLFFIVGIISFIISFFSPELLSLYSYEIKTYSTVLHWVLAIVVIASVINVLDHYANGLGLIKVRVLSQIVFSFSYFIITVSIVESAADLALSMFVAYIFRFLMLYYLLHTRLKWI